MLVNFFGPGSYLKGVYSERLYTLFLLFSGAHLAKTVFHSKRKTSDSEAASDSFPEHSHPLPPARKIVATSSSCKWSTWPVEVDKDWHKSQRCCVHPTTLHVTLQQKDVGWSKYNLNVKGTARLSYMITWHCRLRMMNGWHAKFSASKPATPMPSPAYLSLSPFSGSSSVYWAEID